MPATAAEIAMMTEDELDAVAREYAAEVQKLTQTFLDHSRPRLNELRSSGVGVLEAQKILHEELAGKHTELDKYAAYFPFWEALREKRLAPRDRYWADVYKFVMDWAGMCADKDLSLDEMKSSVTDGITRLNQKAY